MTLGLHYLHHNGHRAMFADYDANPPATVWLTRDEIEERIRDRLRRRRDVSEESKALEDLRLAEMEAFA